ncbi:protein of unknown function [Streptantibioticus cattleyicolor NRRL 8057 = DSM 46488]|nr:protein of unknown function [Streptantibioticus cattleyicolor NRRL 8057 = DSM 46488]
MARAPGASWTNDARPTLAIACDSPHGIPRLAGIPPEPGIPTGIPAPRHRVFSRRPPIGRCRGPGAPDGLAIP